MGNPDRRGPSIQPAKTSCGEQQALGCLVPRQSAVRFPPRRANWCFPAAMSLPDTEARGAVFSMRLERFPLHLLHAPWTRALSVCENITESVPRNFSPLENQGITVMLSLRFDWLSVPSPAQSGIEGPGDDSLAHSEPPRRVFVPGLPWLRRRSGALNSRGLGIFPTCEGLTKRQGRSEPRTRISTPSLTRRTGSATMCFPGG